MKIRPRGGSWQADFGTKAGKRDQKSFGSLDEAKQAIDTHLIQKVEQSRFEAIETKAKVIGWHNLSERQKMDAADSSEYRFRGSPVTLPLPLPRATAEVIIEP